MISYIHKKLAEREMSALKRPEIDKIESINNELKERTVDYLFDCCYYDKYLKKIEKSPTCHQGPK